MKSTKRLIKVKDIGEVITGKTPPTKNGALFGDAYPFITPSDINDYQTRYLQATERGLSDEGYLFQQRYLLPKDSVCYVCIGSTIGKICMTSTDSFTNQQINSIKVNRERFNPYYVFYLLRYITPQIQAITGGSGSGKAILNKSSFENLDVEVHNFEYQNKIASILSAYDDLIENNTRRIKILEEMAQAIYREWFVDFRLPAVAGPPGVKLRKTTHEERKAIGKDVIPEGWEVVRLGDVFEVIGGGTPSTKNQEYWENGTINWYTPSDLTAHRQMFIKESSKKITQLGLKKSSARLFPAYSVMMTSRATLGVISINKYEASTNQGFITCIPKNNESIMQLYHWLQDNVDFIISQASGATFKEITKSIFKNFNYIRATDEVYESFNELINPIIRDIELLIDKNQNLRQTRDLLLPKLVSGEVEV